jgi:hypothetical protein
LKFILSELAMLAYVAVVVVMVATACYFCKSRVRSDAGKPCPHPVGSEFDRMRGMTVEQLIYSFEGEDRAAADVEIP